MVTTRGDDVISKKISTIKVVADGVHYRGLLKSFVKNMKPNIAPHIPGAHYPGLQRLLREYHKNLGYNGLNSITGGFLNLLITNKNPKKF